MRVLIDRTEMGGLAGTDRADGVSLEAAYAVDAEPWLRANMVSTVDGAGTGSDGRSGSINNEADHKVFQSLRRLADAIVVGAGTATAEGYGPSATPIAVVTRRGRLPDRLRDAEPGGVLLVTCGVAPGLDDARAALGDEHVIVAGVDEVDLAAAVQALHDRGFASLLCEGGPSLLGDLLIAGLVDEVCTTVVPLLVGGAHPRIVRAPDLRTTLDLRLLGEEDGTLFARWTVRRGA